MNEVIKVPEGAYQGYWWMSDASEPKVVREASMSGREIEALLEDAGANPFVVEGNFFSPASGVSVGIRQTDGRYVVSVFVTEGKGVDAGDGKHEEVTLKRYHANRMPGLRLLFLQYWREVADPLCEGMPVLVPGEMAFVGFESIN